MRKPRDSMPYLIDEARRAGYAAAMAGTFRSHNPFGEELEPERHQAWEKGWLDLQANRAGRPRKGAKA